MILTSLKFVLKCPINNKPPLLQVMAWLQTGNLSLSALMMTKLTDADIHASLGLNKLTHYSDRSMKFWIQLLKVNHNLQLLVKICFCCCYCYYFNKGKIFQALNVSFRNKCLEHNWASLYQNNNEFNIWFKQYLQKYFIYAPSQWETMLQCEVVSHWLGTYTKSLLCLCRSHTVYYIASCTKCNYNLTPMQHATFFLYWNHDYTTLH